MSLWFALAGDLNILLFIQNMHRYSTKSFERRHVSNEKSERAGVEPD
jgi:hypothetical protein